MRKPRPKDRSPVLVLCPWKEQLLATGAPKGTGTNHDYFHLTPSPLGPIFSFRNQDLLLSGPRSSAIVALTASGTMPKLLVSNPSGAGT